MNPYYCSRPAIPHNTRVKVYMVLPDNRVLYRVPAYITRSIQDYNDGICMILSAISP